MPNKKIFLIDESFDPVFFENYNYYIYLYQNKLIILFLDIRIKKFIYFIHYEYQDYKEVCNILEEHFYYDSRIKNKFFYIESTYFFVPEPFFIQANLNHIYYLLSGKKNAKLYYNFIPDYQNYITYEPFNDINTLTFDEETIIFPDIINCLKLANEYSLKMLKHKEIILINFLNKKFDIIVVNNNKLLLSNRYEFSTHNDILYYIFYVINTLKLNHKELSLLFNGEVEKKNQLEKKLHNYNFKVTYTKLNKNYLYSYRFNELKAHKYADLFYPVK